MVQFANFQFAICLRNFANLCKISQIFHFEKLNSIDLLYKASPTSTQGRYDFQLIFKDVI